jgi:hypothetical protein
LEKEDGKQEWRGSVASRGERKHIAAIHKVGLYEVISAFGIEPGRITGKPQNYHAVPNERSRKTLLDATS